MPSLPRIRRPRGRTLPLQEPFRPEPAEVEAAGLTWVHLDRPDEQAISALAERFGWHELDVEDVLSKRQRPKIDEYPDYLFVVLHFPFYDKNVQRLNAAELDVFLGPDYLVTLPDRPAAAGHAALHALPRGRGVPDRALRQGLGPPALRDPRRPLRLLLPDPRQDRAQARLDRGRHVRGPLRGGRARHLQREAGDHLVPQDHQARAPHAACCWSGTSSASCPRHLELYFDDIVDASERIWDLLDNYKEVVEALEGTNESVISHRQNDVLRMLTLFSVILLPLTLITGIFGMNVDFPGFDTAAAFWVIVGA